MEVAVLKVARAKWHQSESIRAKGRGGHVLKEVGWAFAAVAVAADD